MALNKKLPSSKGMGESSGFIGDTSMKKLSEKVWNTCYNIAQLTPKKSVKHYNTA